MTPANYPFAPEVSYRARVKRPVMVGAFKYLPRDEPEFLGAMLNAIVEENGADVLDYAFPL